MFGYVKIAKDELRVREYNVFRAYYCGLCKTLKKEYGFASRMGLSYDVTFLALLLSSLCEEETSFVPERCIVSPVRKKPMARPFVPLSYTAAVNVMLTVGKIRDNWRDEHSVKALLAMPVMAHAKRKVKKKYPELFSVVEKHLKQLSRLEKEQCDELDRLAEEFAGLMQEVFSAAPGVGETERRILSHIGYGLGRFIYILDAYEDREKDKKENNFNPFLLAKEPPDTEEIRQMLEFTLSEISNSYQLLNIKRNRPILDNILYLGLPESMSRVFDGVKKEKEVHERSL